MRQSKMLWPKWNIGLKTSVWHWTLGGTSRHCWCRFALLKASTRWVVTHCQLSNSIVTWRVWWLMTALYCLLCKTFSPVPLSRQQLSWDGAGLSRYQCRWLRDFGFFMWKVQSCHCLQPCLWQTVIYLWSNATKDGPNASGLPKAHSDASSTSRVGMGPMVGAHPLLWRTLEQPHPLMTHLLPHSVSVTGSWGWLCKMSKRFMASQVLHHQQGKKQHFGNTKTVWLMLRVTAFYLRPPCTVHCYIIR